MPMVCQRTQEEGFPPYGRLSLGTLFARKFFLGFLATSLAPDAVGLCTNSIRAQIEPPPIGQATPSGDSLPHIYLSTLTYLLSLFPYLIPALLCPYSYCTQPVHLHLVPPPIAERLRTGGFSTSDAMLEHILFVLSPTDFILYYLVLPIYTYMVALCAARTVRGVPRAEDSGS